MRDPMPYLPLTFALFLMAALLQGTAARAGTFLIDGTAAELSGTPIREGWTMIGLVDDYIELNDGDHRLYFEGPHDHGLILRASVNGDRFHVVETEVVPPNCAEVYDIDWSAPQVARDPDHPGVQRVILPPIRAVPTGERSGCMAMAMAACNEQKTIVELKSDPPGGEVWFSEVYGGWQKHDFRTNVTLSVPFCEGAQAKSVLVRMTGRVNCLEEVALAPEARVTVSCNLRDPGEADPLETSAAPN